MLSEIGKRNVGVIEARTVPNYRSWRSAVLMSIDRGVLGVMASSLADLDSLFLERWVLIRVCAIWFPVRSERREASMLFIDSASGQCPSVGLFLSLWADSTATAAWCKAIVKRLHVVCTSSIAVSIFQAPM